MLSLHLNTDIHLRRTGLIQAKDFNGVTIVCEPCYISFIKTGTWFLGQQPISKRAQHNTSKHGVGASYQVSTSCRPGLVECMTACLLLSRDMCAHFPPWMQRTLPRFLLETGPHGARQRPTTPQSSTTDADTAARICNCVGELCAGLHSMCLSVPAPGQGIRRRGRKLLERTLLERIPQVAPHKCDGPHS